MTLSVAAVFNRAARVFYAACCRMVFGLSSSKPHDSPAIVCHQAQFSTTEDPRNLELNYGDTTLAVPVGQPLPVAVQFRRRATRLPYNFQIRVVS